jgi:hypothetical protein
MLPRGLADSNPNQFLSCERKVEADTKRWKLHLSESIWFQESICGICFTNKWKAAPLQLSLELDNFKPMLKYSIFRCISWLIITLRSFCVNVEVFWKRESRPIELNQYRLLTRQFPSAYLQSMATPGCTCRLVFCIIRALLIRWTLQHRSQLQLASRFSHQCHLVCSAKSGPSSKRWNGIYWQSGRQYIIQNICCVKDKWLPTRFELATYRGYSHEQQSGHTIDYMCVEMVFFRWCPQVTSQYQTQLWFPVVKQGIRGVKSIYMHEVLRQEDIDDMYFKKNWRAKTRLQPRSFRIRHFGTPAWKGFLWMHFLGWTVSFTEMIGVFWARFKSYLMSPMFPPDLPTFFCIHIYCLLDALDISASWGLHKATSLAAAALFIETRAGFNQS